MAPSWQLVFTHMLFCLQTQGLLKAEIITEIVFLYNTVIASTIHIELNQMFQNVHWYVYL